MTCPHQRDVTLRNGARRMTSVRPTSGSRVATGLVRGRCDPWFVITWFSCERPFRRTPNCVCNQLRQRDDLTISCTSKPHSELLTDSDASDQCFRQHVGHKRAQGEDGAAGPCNWNAPRILTARGSRMSRSAGRATGPDTHRGADSKFPAPLACISSRSAV